MGAGADPGFFARGAAGSEGGPTLLRGAPSTKRSLILEAILMNIKVPKMQKNVTM